MTWSATAERPAGDRLFRDGVLDAEDTSRRGEAMYFFTLLFVVTGLARMATRLGSRTPCDRRACMRAGMTAGFLFTGTDHVLNPDRYHPMLPSYLPFPRQIVWASGLCEITGAVGLMTRRWRRAAGLLLALYLVSETPANLKLAVEGVLAKGMPASPWFYRGRLLLIPLAIWWAWDCGVRASSPDRDT